MAEQAPLAARMRPRALDEIVGQPHLLGPGAPLRALIETDRLSSILLWGPPGTGKTTLAAVVALRTNRQFVSMSAVTAGVKDVREVIEAARVRWAEEDRGTILFLDEGHRFNKSQQDALLPAVESGIVTLIGATTENPFFEVNAPLISRSTVFRLEPLKEADLTLVVERALMAEHATIVSEALTHLVDMADGDARAALNTLEVALALASSDQRGDLTLEDVERARQTRVLRYGEDDHYDIISAFIYLATAPKSNTTMAALSRAFDDVRKRQAGIVPAALRSIHPYQRNKMKEGGGYRYPHNDPSGFIPQEYRPSDIAGEVGTADR